MKSIITDRISDAIEKSFFSIVFLFIILLLSTTSGSSQTTWNVSSSADAGANTLREAINNSVHGDIININVSSEIKIDSGLYVFLKDLTINGNGATINSTNSRNYTFYFEITNIEVSDLTMKNLSTSFPVITAYNAGSVTLDGCTIEDNPTTSVKGGAIYSEVPVVLKNSTIENNTAASGAGIFMDFNSLTLQNTTIKDNTATGTSGGGGIICMGAFEMTGSEIINNSAPRGPTGGLSVFNFDKTTITNSKINNNTADKDAGGCFIVSALELTDSEISENTSGGTGGGVLFANIGGTIPSSITNSTISHNRAKHSGGVGYSGPSLTVKDSHIESNKATQLSGGGLFIGSGMLTLENSTVNDNEAASTGGGIYSNVDCIIDNSEVNSNTTSDKGGGIFMYNSKLELKNQSEVNGNTARIDGGGIYLNNSGSTQLIANNSVINDNKTTLYGGGGIHIRPNGHKKTLTNCEVNGNTANTEGGGIYNQGDLELNNVTMKDNKGRFGGGLYVYSGMAEINHTSINENEAVTDGGGVYSRTKLTIQDNSTLNDNKAGQTGGGLWLSHSGQSSTISQSDVNGNKALRAAGILLGNGTVTIQQESNVNDNQNTGNYDGAGIYNGNTALTINNSAITNNKTPANGGGIYVGNSGGASLSTDQADISGNEAGGSGGGIYLNTTADIQNSTLNDNTATGPGGGMYVRELGSAQLNISGSHINHNTSSHGGGIMLYHNSNSNTITNCELKNNEVTKQGGGLWLKSNTTISGTTFDNNSAQTEGGGIFMDQGTSVISGSSLSTNTALNGAGLYIRIGNLQIQSTAIEQNKSVNAGGGILQNQGSLSISTQSSINNNESSNSSGGGIYVINGELTLKNSEINNNKVKNGGGGIYLNSSTNVKFTADNCSFNDNTTQIYGGAGLLIKANNHIKTIRNCRIQGNTAHREGGGLVNNGTLEILENSIIKNNESEISEGGGIFNTGELTLDNIAIEGNKAKTLGGGLYCEGQLDLDQVTVSENMAYDGGGLYANTGSALIKNNSSFSLNKATHNGGGLYSSSVNFTIENNSTIQSNEAGQYGGGMFLNAGTHLIKNSSILANKSIGNSGGGIYFKEQSLTLENAKVNNNASQGSKGGGIHNEKGALIIKNSEINGNSALTWGGGIYSSYLEGAISFSISDSKINGNSANNGGGISVDVINAYTIEQTEFKNNEASENGGGIYIIGGTGTVDMIQTTIQDNEAKRGGGIYNSSMDLKVTNSDINGNTSSQNGGGVYNANQKITLKNSKLNDNTSSHNGGGIWNNGTLDISNSEIRDNTAKYWGGGIHTLGTTTCQKVIIEGNSATDGGGIGNIASLTIAYSTITNNSAVNSGGLINLNFGSFNGIVNLNNSIISLNNGGDIRNRASISGDYNLLSDYTDSGLTASGSHNLTGDPLFVSDFSNLNLTGCSPAIDAASNGDDMGALQSGLTAIVPVITTTSITVSLTDQHPNMVSIDPSMVQYNFQNCTDISISLAPVDFDCSHVGQTLTTTATVTYSGGQTFQQDIPVIVLDEAAPEFTSSPQEAIYLQHSDPLPDQDPVSYTDNCGGIVTLTVTDEAPVGLECGERIDRTYAISDVHGNSTEFVQTIIIGDGMGPEIIVFDEEKMDVVDLSAPPQYTVHHDTSFTDFTSDEILAQYCGQSKMIQRTYTAQDACHNVTVNVRNIMFSDEMKPVLVKEADFLQKIENGDTIDWVDCIYPDPTQNDISWSDNSGNATVKTNVYDLPLPDSVPFGMFKFLNYEYSVEDKCMNSSDLDFYMGLYDLQGPVYRYIPHDTVISSTQDLPPIPDDVNILDVCNYVVCDTVITRPIIDPLSGDTTAFSRKWMARDVVGHETFSEQIIHVQSIKEAYGRLTARTAYYDKLIPGQFEGEIGENGIHFTLYRLNGVEKEKSQVDKTTSQNWFGRNGSTWFTGISPGRYQIQMDLPEGYYIQSDTMIDSLGWSDTLHFSDEELVDLGLLVLTPLPDEVDSIVLDSAQVDTVAVDSQFVSELPHMVRNQEWKVYPNPSYGQIKIEFDSHRKRQYDLFDRTGKQVRSGQVSGGEMLDLDGLVNGMYILQLREGGDVLGHKKVVLVR